MYKRGYTYIYNILFVLAVLFIIQLIYIRQQREGFKASIQTFEIPFYIERKNTDSPLLVSRVPLTLYQSWHTNMVPAKMKETIYKLLEMNPEFDYYLYSDEASSKFIQEHYEKEVADAFAMLKPGAYKSDLWRYCILYKRGGVYLDIKYTTLSPLVPIVEKHPIVYVKDRWFACSHIKEGPGLYNGFLISPPNNSIFKHCIDDILNSCRFKLYKSNDLDITGPCLLAEMVYKYSPNYQSEFKYDELADRQPVIYYNNTKLCFGYPEYRTEQKQFQKSAPYGFLWKNKDVYN